MPKAVNPLVRRKSSSTFSSLQRTKPNARKSSLAADQSQLADTGLICSLAPKHVPQDVLSLVRHIQSICFDEIPDRAAGMNSERISAILRYRKGLPAIVSLAHLHALSRSSTATEREVAMLIAGGKVRKVSIPGRGRGGTAVGDGIVLIEDWLKPVREDYSLSEEVKEKYIALLSAHRASSTAPTTSFTAAEERSLVEAGFLTSPGALTASLNNVFTAPGIPKFLRVSSAGSTNATGTLAAIGGIGAVHENGGSGSILATKDTRISYLADLKARDMTFSLPGTGAYLKLLVAARQHFLYLLKSLSPKYREVTRDVLKERWEGNTPGDAISRLKRERGEWAGVLPGKTKKWREFFGMRFEWVLAECVGGGLVEMFETGSVGLAVRGR